MNENKDNKSNGLSSELAEENIKELCHLINKIDDDKFLYDFFNCLFTKTELKEFASRWILVKKIDEGVTQREIAKQYNMSLCKITRGSKELRKDESAFKKALELLKSEIN